MDVLAAGSANLWECLDRLTPTVSQHGLRQLAHNARLLALHGADDLSSENLEASPLRDLQGRRGLQLGLGPRLTWHDCGMARTRLSTTVNADLLDDARRVRSGGTDAALIDAALEAFLAHHRAAEVDAGYAAYDEHPLDEPDEWGDLASFRQAAAAS